MKISIIGAGNVGQALARGCVRAGHSIIFGVQPPMHASRAARLTGIAPDIAEHIGKIHARADVDSAINFNFVAGPRFLSITKVQMKIIIIEFAAALLLSTVVRAQQAPSMQAGLEAFARIASVMQHPRCLNCHPRGDRPTQGEMMHTHQMNVQRGLKDKGVAAMNCAMCHQSQNNDRAKVPGAPNWHLAPVSMGWTGLSVSDLCRTLLDKSKNGNRSVADLVKHMTTDPLVLWGWEPGAGRSVPPVSGTDLKMFLDLWAAAGAPCPN